MQRCCDRFFEASGVHSTQQARKIYPSKALSNKPIFYFKRFISKNKKRQITLSLFAFLIIIAAAIAIAIAIATATATATIYRFLINVGSD